MKKVAAKKRVPAIERKNGTIQKTKSCNKRGKGGKGGGPIVKTLPNCNNCGKHHDAISNNTMKAVFRDRLNSNGKPNWTKKE